jgi:hypothetical protein
MDPKEKKELFRIVEENNEMIHKMRGAQKRTWWLSFMKYLLFFAVALGGYYLVQPFIENINTAYDSFLGTVQGIQDTGDDIKNFGGLFGGGN